MFHGVTSERTRPVRLLELIVAIMVVMFVFATTSFAVTVRAAVPVTNARITPNSATAEAAATTPPCPTVNTVFPAANPGPPAPKKAVIVVGPFSADTANAIIDACKVVNAAIALNMNVTWIVAPHATWSQVVDAANGADFFEYIGHGNGWPSPYAPFQENSKDGLGLDAHDGDSNYSVKYYGADKIIASIKFAPNAIVLLNKLCYSSGNGEVGMVMPTQDVAVQRIDNFAAGFLAAGARTVFTLKYQPGEELLNALYQTHQSMDSWFMTNYGSNTDGSWKSYFGYIGSAPDQYFDSVRTPGARIHIDTDSPTTGAAVTLYKGGYQRGVTGDLDFTTDQWLGNGDGSTDTTPPDISQFDGQQDGATIPSSQDSPPVFTPNSDGISDTLALDYTVSEASYLDFVVTDGDGNTVRDFTAYAAAGDGSTTWDGKGADGKVVPEGRYTITVTPTDLAGNVGDAQTTAAKVLLAMKSPKSAPALFYARDGDALASSTTLSVTLTEPATMSWKIVDANGDTVRTLVDAVDYPAGAASATWDGKDDSGAYVPDGVYTQWVTASTDAGTYSNKLDVTVMAFKVTAPTWTGPAGTKVTFTITSAEPLTGWPVIQVRQPGLTMYKGAPVKYSSTKFKVTITLKAGTAGQVAIKLTGTDTGGGVQTQTVYFTLTN